MRETIKFTALGLFLVIFGAFITFLISRRDRDTIILGAFLLALVLCVLAYVLAGVSERREIERKHLLERVVQAKTAVMPTVTPARQRFAHYTGTTYGSAPVQPSKRDEPPPRTPRRPGGPPYANQEFEAGRAFGAMETHLMPREERAIDPRPPVWGESEESS